MRRWKATVRGNPLPLKYLFWLKEQGWHRKCFNELKLIIYWKRQGLETTKEIFERALFCRNPFSLLVCFAATRFAHDVTENFLS